ncbi:uncharacterized protein Z520_00498 [Fonsecaea multimorphosa CBS 102226]|uniref:GDP/GTP exchange factor Sec2 N-terminal domain-containing protein n=1 Tax=Fonsecaea multimorphosa CBS 102226 TaxID=1442371 RepID=A0A0D2J2Z5_9EURO|nr:uncharacterized protein Z520_00498 [Fonsecaea multimorphosa CBS 102226]KIY03807.1 hypothetical protein Z520_00498 [Fonsecaea multimorphosa CBS 102226]
MDPSFAASAASHHSSPDHTCPQCGFFLHSPSESAPEAAETSEAKRRIRDLEAQVRLLNSKAAAAVDKLADYEDEIQYLRDAYSKSQQQQQQARSYARLSIPPGEGTGSTTTPGQTPPQQQQQQSRLASISAFLPGRKRDANNSVVGQNPLTPATGTFPQNSAALFSNATLSPPKTPFLGVGAISSNSTPILSSSSTLDNNQSTVSLLSLQSSLEEERTLRIRAESSLSQTQTELEELTAQLFGQANEMVANERKARAKLEERVKVLEQRDVEKRKRLERLEKAVSRIERVRGMVGD